MTLLERLEAAAASPADWDIPDLLNDCSFLFGAILAMAKAMSKAAAAQNTEDFYAALTALNHLGNCPSYGRSNGKMLVCYDQMDPADVSKTIKLAICPSCKSLGKVILGKNSDIFVHTSLKRLGKRRRGKERRRRYCKIFHDGRQPKVIVPMLDPQEEP